MTDTKTETVTPFLRWAGSKRKLISQLQHFWSPGYDRYVEPFAGSSCLFFALQPKSALLADKNAQLIELYEVVRERPSDLFQAFKAIPRTKARYLTERSKKTSRLRKFDRAVRFLYLNRNCFNGIFRTNLSGEFNVPFASERVAPYFTEAELLKCAALLDRAELRAWDFGTTLRYVRPSDFVYLDPPFAVSTRRVFREYGISMFALDDVARLRRHLIAIAARGASFLVSYADSPEARRLAVGWRTKRVIVRRHVAGFSGARRRAYELLIFNATAGGLSDGD